LNNFSEQQEPSWSGLNKNNYNHTEPNDPYFSPEQASKRGPELHPPGYNFLGPRTEFFARMIGSDFYKQMMINAGRTPVGKEPYNVPVNELDKCAYEHDAIFSRNNNTEKNIRDADIKFRECASNIKDANLKYYIQIQLAKTAIGLKEFGEDMGFIKPELYANINKNINDLNLTLAKNHTIPSTKEEQQQQDRNFLYGVFLLSLRMVSNTILQGFSQLTTRQLIQISKDINLLNYITPSLRPWAIRTANLILSGETTDKVSMVRKSIIGFGQTLINYLLSSTDFFGTGIYGQVIQTLVEKIGYDKIAEFIMDNLLLRYSIAFASNSWRERNIMTKEELEQIIKGEDPAIHIAEQEADTQFKDAFGFSVQNTRAREIIDLFNNIQNLTNNQKIQRFGQFNRAIIQIRNRYRSSLFNIVYILLNGTIQSSLVADITVERLRNILNQRISEPDIDTLLSRPRLIRKLENTFNFQYDREVFRQFTYMEFIDKFLKELFTLNGLEELLS